MGGSHDLEVARRERLKSEARLQEVEPVAVTLHEMRDSNHIRPLLRTLISRSNARE
jgi:hypothetical protein